MRISHERGEVSRLVREAHLRALEDEEIGVRHRIREFYLPLFLQYARDIGKPASEVRILDCGCGNGASVEYLADAGFQAFGIDLAGFRAEQWTERSKLPNVHLIAADATAMPFPDRYFDVVFSCGMLEHIGVAEECTPRYQVRALPDQLQLRQRFLSESMRVIQPGGILYIDHPNGSFPIDFWHNDYRGLPRLHWPSEHFLPTFAEVATIARTIAPTCSVEPVSPAGRFTFRRSGRRWYGKIFAGAMKLYFDVLKRRPFSSLSRSSLNPYLVIRITGMEGPL